MATLHDIETHEGLNKKFQNLFKEAVRHIVGVESETGDNRRKYFSEAGIFRCPDCIFSLRYTGYSL